MTTPKGKPTTMAMRKLITISIMKQQSTIETKQQLKKYSVLG